MDWESLVWNTEMPWAQRYLMLALSRVADRDGKVAMSSGLMSDASHMPASTIRFLLPQMIAAGLLTKDESGVLHIHLSNSDGTRQSLTVRVSPQIQKHTQLTARVRPEIPFPLNNPLSNPSVVLSPVSSFSPVLENKELGQEGISISEAQGELISVDAPAWLTDLRTTPGYDLDAAHERRLIERVDAAAISTQRLCETAASIAAKWESVKWSLSNKNGYKRIDLTFVAWAKRENTNGNGSKRNGYVAPEFVPNTSDYYKPGSTLTAFRRSHSTG